MEGVGLSLYLNSLNKISELTKTEELYGLPAHENPVYPIYKRAEEIEEFHKERLAAVLKICRHPKTVSQITQEYYQAYQPEIFNDLKHPVFNRFLAFQEIAAHLEYLEDTKMIEPTNRKETEEGTAARIYQSRI